MDDGSSHARLRNCDIRPQLIVHVRKDCDVLWLPNSGVCLNRKRILNPNVLRVDNWGCVNRRNGRVSDKTDYQQSQSDSDEFELRI
jgi:hypothetical protein